MCVVAVVVIILLLLVGSNATAMAAVDGDSGKRMTVRVRETCVQMVHSAHTLLTQPKPTKTMSASDAKGKPY